MGGAELGQQARPFGGEGQVHDAPVGIVATAHDQPGGDRTVDQPHRAVVLQHEVLGNVADGRRAAAVAADGEQELVLRRGQPDRLRLLPAPGDEATQTVTELEEAGVPVVVQLGLSIEISLSHLYRITILHVRPRRLLFLTALAVAVGLLAGGAAWVLLHLIALLTNAALFGRVSATLPSLAHFHDSPRLVIAAVVGGLVIAALARWSPVIRGHGIPEAMEAVLLRQSRVAPRTAIAKPLSAAIAIGTGGPFGAEGPIIVTGGALGSLIGQVLPVSPSERKILLACGAAAGMAATFGAPLAAVVLAIELLLFEFSTRAFVPLVAAASVAGGVHSALFGSGPLFTVPHHDFAGLTRLPLYIVLGAVCGLAAVVITKGLFLVEAGFRRLPVSEFWHPAIGAIGFSLVGIVAPRVLGVGYDQISAVLATKLGIGALAVLALAKLVAWWLALGSGTSGGTLAPILLISGAFGSLTGQLAVRAMPGLHVSPGAFALVAMAATFGAATRATFTSIVFLFELTRDYNAILPLMMAAVIADLVALALTRDSLMTEKLTRRGVRVPTDYHADVLRTTPVRQVMTEAARAVTLPATATVADAVACFEETHHGAYPVVDETGRVIGMIGRRDFLRDDIDDGAPVRDVMSPDVVTVGPDDDVNVGLERMLEEEVEHLPVVHDGVLVGICTRTDILRARHDQFVHERREPGWSGGIRLLR
jgi:H+/Cl- antiporter ClcA/CBS domain-containing protein